MKTEIKERFPSIKEFKIKEELTRYYMGRTVRFNGEEVSKDYEEQYIPAELVSVFHQKFTKGRNEFHRTFLGFEKVAEIFVPAEATENKKLNIVWEKTQNIDSMWTEDNYVFWNKEEKTRSSMIGDLFITSDGKIHQVSKFGFDVVDGYWTRLKDDKNVLSEIGKCK